MSKTILLFLLVILVNLLIPFRDESFFPFIVFAISGISGYLFGSHIAPFLDKLFHV